VELEQVLSRERWLVVERCWLGRAQWPRAFEVFMLRSLRGPILPHRILTQPMLPLRLLLRHHFFHVFLLVKLQYLRRN